MRPWDKAAGSKKLHKTFGIWQNPSPGPICWRQRVKPWLFSPAVLGRHVQKCVTLKSRNSLHQCLCVVVKETGGPDSESAARWWQTFRLGVHDPNRRRLGLDLQGRKTGAHFWLHFCFKWNLFPTSEPLSPSPAPSPQRETLLCLQTLPKVCRDDVTTSHLHGWVDIRL